jgi:hypothetical protein
MGWSWNVVIVQPGPFHSECRTIFKRAIGLNEVVKHDPLIQEEAKNLLDGLEVLRGDPWETVQGYATSSFNLAAPGFCAFIYFLLPLILLTILIP